MTSENNSIVRIYVAAKDDDPSFIQFRRGQVSEISGRIRRTFLELGLRVGEVDGVYSKTGSVLKGYGEGLGES